MKDNLEGIDKWFINDEHAKNIRFSSEEERFWECVAHGVPAIINGKKHDFKLFSSIFRDTNGLYGSHSEDD